MKKILFPLVAILLLASCQKEINTSAVTEKAKPSVTAGKSDKVSICHRTASSSNSWESLSISRSALPAHLAHGDIVPDEDGDGFTKTNPCGTGTQDDCDDENDAINPAATEVCDNGVDDNCDGQTDENCIASVTICGQVWMLKNLDVSTYANGDPIPEVTSASDWITSTTGAWCYYANNTANGVVYGKLYNWYAVNDPRGLAPAGWHVATHTEWGDLQTCLGADPGGKIKEAGFAHWAPPNTGATNSSGFTALPAGGRSNSDGSFFGLTTGTTWWTATELNATEGRTRFVVYDATFLAFPGFSVKSTGCSVRCIKD